MSTTPPESLHDLLLREIADPSPAVPAVPVERRTTANLEVEVSFAAGFLASSAALAYFAYDFAKSTGFTHHVDLYFFMLGVTVIELFDVGLVFYLMQRGVWLAATQLARNDSQRWDSSVEGADNFRRSTQRLEQQARATLYASFYYLLQGLVFMVGMLGIWMLDTEDPFSATAGWLIICSFAIYFFLGLPGRFSRRWREGFRARVEDVSRYFGLGWAHPPESRLKVRTMKYGLVTILGTFLFYMINLALVFEPSLTLEREVYHKGQDHVAILHFRHGGLRGVAGKHVTAKLQVDGKIRIPVEQVELNHSVAVIPLDELEAGSHELLYAPVYQNKPDPKGEEDYTVTQGSPLALCFYLAPASPGTASTD